MLKCYNFSAHLLGTVELSLCSESASILKRARSSEILGGLRKSCGKNVQRHFDLVWDGCKARDGDENAA